MEYIFTFIDFFVHLDKYIGIILERYGLWTYLLLFIVIFCETGLVVTPFLPGDSLIFVVGMFAAHGELSVWWLYAVIGSAAILGNMVNYSIGSYLGPAVLERDTRILKKSYLDKTHSYFEKYGAATVVVARFLPIVRTFAPFMAGVGKMSYVKFTVYNLVGCVAWVTSFLFAGYFFGNIPMIRNNLTFVIFGIVAISFAPTAFELLRHKLKKNKTK